MVNHAQHNRYVSPIDQMLEYARIEKIDLGTATTNAAVASRIASVLRVRVPFPSNDPNQTPVPRQVYEAVFNEHPLGMGATSTPLMIPKPFPNLSWEHTQLPNHSPVYDQNGRPHSQECDIPGEAVRPHPSAPEYDVHSCKTCGTSYVTPREAS